MGQRMTFDKAEKSEDKPNYDFPKFAPKGSEHARVFMLEFPLMEVVHRLEHPTFKNGVPDRSEETAFGKKKIRYNNQKFLGTPICLGNPTKESGWLDGDHCPICALHLRDAEIMPKPVRRFAVPLWRYGNRAGSFDLLPTYSGRVEFWNATENYFGKLNDYHNTWDLTKHDLLIKVDTSKSSKFPQLDIQIAPDAAWQKRENPKQERENMLAALEEQAVDLSNVAGSKWGEALVNSKLKELENAWAQVRAYDNGTSDRGMSLDDGLSSMVESPRAARAARQSRYDDEEPTSPTRREAPAEREQVTTSAAAATAVAEKPAEPEATSEPMGFEDFDLFAED